jgi:hypothetical protein
MMEDSTRFGGYYYDSRGNCTGICSGFDPAKRRRRRSVSDRRPNVVHFGNERIDIVDQSMEFICYLSDAESPQGQAFEWMTSDDVKFSGLSVDDLVQLYALVTLFYATNGTAAWESEGWLNMAMLSVSLLSQERQKYGS